MEQGETFNDTKQRLSDLTKIKGKQLDKIKFALVTRGQSSKPEYLEDGTRSSIADAAHTDIAPDDIISDLIGSREDVYLGLDHTNKSRSFWGKSDSIFIK